MRRGTLGLVFDIVRIPFVVGSPFIVAAWVGHDARSDRDPHYGDPDGESIVQVFQIASGLATFLVTLLVVLIVEVARRRWRRQHESEASSVGPQSPTQNPRPPNQSP